MVVAAPSRSSAPAPAGKLARKLSVVAGAAGVVAAGAGEVEAVTYTPTAGVVAAQGIPDFSFVDATNVTLGTLRPPATAGTTGWDVDGIGGSNFTLSNSGTVYASLRGSPGVGSFRTNIQLANLQAGVTVSQAQAWNAGGFVMTAYSGISQPSFSLNTPGQFGFRFTNGSDTHYGWGSLVIDTAGSALGQGFKITEAYYNSTPGGAISVGAVPVPEPTAMALLAIGSAGVFAWRARRKNVPATKSGQPG